MAANRKLDRHRDDTRFMPFEIIALVANPASRIAAVQPLRFGEVFDFSLSFCLRHPAAWPAAFQITIKNNAEFSLFELLRDVLSKNFSKRAFPLFGFSCSFPFTNAGITGCIKFPLYGLLSCCTCTWIGLPYRPLRPYAHRLGRAQPPRTSASERRSRLGASTLAASS